MMDNPETTGFVPLDVLAPVTAEPQGKPATVKVAVDPGETIGVVSEKLFGAILINKTGYYEWLEDHEHLGTTFMRWPGGTIAEHGIIRDGQIITSGGNINFQDLGPDRSMFAYDLRNPQLISPLALDLHPDHDHIDVAPFSEVLAHTVYHGNPVAVIVPVERYFNGVDYSDKSARNIALSVARDDLSFWFDRGVKGAWNNGVYPYRVILEIGNETYGNPIEYAFLVRAFISEAREHLARIGQLIDIDIAVQMNKGSKQFNTLVDNGYFDTWFNSDGSAKIPELKGIVYDPEDMTYSEKKVFIEKVMIKIIGDRIADIDLLRHHTLSLTLDTLQDPDSLLNQRSVILDYWRDAITRAGGNGDKVGYYISAWTASSGDDPDGAETYGMAAAPVAALAMADFVRQGVELAAVWGVLAGDTYPSKGMPDNAITAHNSDTYAPYGQVISLMAKNLSGMRYVEDGTDDKLDLDNPRDAVVLTFRNETTTILYVVVGDIPKDGLTVALDLSAFIDNKRVEISLVHTADGKDVGPGIITVTREDVANGLLNLTFKQDYAVAQIKMQINGFDGANQMAGTPHADTMRGTSDRDVILGYGKNDTLFGLASNDRIHGGDGDDRGSGNDGLDSLWGDAGRDRLYGGGDNDWGNGGGGDDTLWGGTGRDTLRGDVGRDTLYGQDGNDLLYGDAGNDQLRGGGQNDMLYGAAGADQMWGDAGIDRLFGGSEADRLYGGNGADTLWGEGGNDTLIGGDGQDVLDGAAGRDTLRGGLGDDILRGGGDADALFGDVGRDSLYGQDGNDNLQGGADSDRLWGGNGNDTVQGQDGNDTLYGEAGNDKLVGDTGDDSLTGGGGNDTLYGRIGNDRMDGGDGTDTLYGEDGDDVLFGGAGSDSLNGGDGNDLLRAGGQADTLMGGAGNDTLDGGTGNDTMTGGPGSDSFVFSGAFGADTITDFDPATDVLRIDRALVGPGIDGEALLGLAGVPTSQGLVIDLGAAGSITLTGVSLTDPGLADSIIFV